MGLEGCCECVEYAVVNGKQGWSSMFVVGRETNSSSSLMIKTFINVKKKNEMDGCVGRIEEKIIQVLIRDLEGKRPSGKARRR
jgi:hypothetical protein